MACLEAGKICGLCRRTLPQCHVEQNFDSDVRDRTSGTLCYAECAKLAERVSTLRLERGEFVKGVIGEMVEAHAARERGIGDRAESRTEHRGKVRQHRAEHECRRFGEAPGDDRVAEEVHPLVKKRSTVDKRPIDGR